MSVERRFRVCQLIAHDWGPAATGSRITASRSMLGRASAKPKVSEDLSPLELLRQENELLRETINSADKDIEELEAQLQVTNTRFISSQL